MQALLDNLKRISAEAAAEDELNTARRYLADIFAVRMETVGSVADMVVALRGARSAPTTTTPIAKRSAA